MSRVLCLLLCVSSFAFSQTSNIQSNGSSPVQVVYTIDGSTLTTYNVDPQTFQAAEVGTITLPESTYPYLITSPNGHFLYYIAYQDSSGEGKRLYVYDTHASGLPHRAPVQKMLAQHLLAIAMHPSGNFLYRVTVGNLSGLTATYTIERNLIDEHNGAISQPVQEAKYHLDNGSSSNNCSLAILGFNNSGTIMYDAVFCSGPHATNSATYYMRSVDVQTGALGTDQQIYGWNYYGGSGGESVQFINNLMFDFVLTDFSGTYVNIYRAKPNVSKPRVNCTSSMWTVCGNYGYALAHPSGEYVFLYDSSNNTDIGQVNLSTRQIAQTSSIPYEVREFSPDGTIVYASVNNANSVLEIEIYGFSVASGQVTQGGTITAPSNLDPWFAAERY